MLFNSLNFILFFAFVFVTYWLSGALPFRRERVARFRILFLLVVSYFFYGCWDWRFLFLIFFSTVLDFGLGRAIQRQEEQKRRFRWVAASVAINLTFLGIFKYFNFFINSASDLLQLAGVQMAHSTLKIILPVGISFYTFQSLSYTIDIYRRKLEPEPSFFNFAFFISFFPHIVAGPIVRAADFLPQIHRDHRLWHINFDGAFDLILRGFVKKVLVSDVIATFSDQFFANPGQFGTINSWLGVLTYALQIYCDFSGYTDIAIGVAHLLGYHLTRNFDFPYMARGFSDFWKRWHISLSIWLRDYLYISLGGNRKGRLLTYRNLMLTMLLGGLWHGASYNFIIWGGLHGIYLCIERLWKEFVPQLPRWLHGVLAPAEIAVTFLLVCLAWVFFRAPDVKTALIVLHQLFWWKPDAALAAPVTVVVLLALGYALHAMGEISKYVPQRAMGRVLLVWRPVRYCMLLTILILLSQDHEQPFIYFQF